MIDAKDVEHIAHLARIELDEDERKRFREELSAILEFVGKLNEVDTMSIEPMTGGGEPENVMREDEQMDMDLEGRQVSILTQVPETKESWVKVKAIFNS